MADVTGTYYAGDAFIGYGAELRIGQGDDTPGPETFVAVPDVMTITPGDATTGVVDTTHLRSPNRHREKKATLRDSGAFTIAGNYRPDHGAHMPDGGDGFLPGYSLLDLWQNVTEANFEIGMPADASDTEIVLAIRGVVTRYQVGAFSTEDKVEFTAEITPLHDYERVTSLRARVPAAPPVQTAPAQTHARR